MDSTNAEIISRMEVVRARKRERIADLNEESSRMTDWREHVRSAPLLTLAASVAAGALGAASLTRGASQLPHSVPETATIASAKGTIASSALSTVWSMALPMLTRYVRQKVVLALTENSVNHGNVKKEGFHDRRNT